MKVNNFQHTFTWLATSLLMVSAVNAADHLTLQDDDKLTGTIKSIQADGSITLSYPNARNEVTLSPGSLKNIEFDNDTAKASEHTERVHLSNGDQLPCRLIELNDTDVTFETWYAGQFKIPRTSVKRIDFDNKLESLIFSGPANKAQWDSLDNWTFAGDSLNVTGAGTAAKKCDLPSNFALKYRLNWTGTTPKFRLHFGGTSDTTTAPQDRYYLAFNSAGIQLVRVTPRQSPSLGEYEFPYRIRDLKSRSLSFELRVDRKNKQVVLYIDNEKVKTFTDTMVTVPMGDVIVFESNMAEGSTLSLSNVKVIDWSGLAIDGESIGDEINSDCDTLFHDGADRTSGITKRIVRNGEKLTIQMTSPHSANKVWEVPAEHANSLHLFAAEASDKKTTSHYRGQLNGGGVISLNSLQLEDGTIATTHPILGKYQLKPFALKTLSTINK